LVATGNDIKWYSTATGGVPLPPGTALINEATYYATQTVNGCESTTRLEVLVNVTGALSPKGNGSQTLCEGATVTNLVADGSDLKWYATVTGGSPLAPSMVLTNGTRYYATQTLNSCESPSRLEVLVNIVTPPPTPTGVATQTFCQGATLANLLVSGSGTQWYSTAAGGNVLPVSTILVNNSTYFVSQTVNGCESANRLSVTALVNPNPPAPVGEAQQSVEEGKTVADLIASGTSIKWYSSENDALNKVNPLPLSTPLIIGASYYATQTVAGCESNAFLIVTTSLITSIELTDPKLDFYPNPVRDVLIISLKAGIDQVTVTNLVGQTVFSKKVGTEQCSIDFSDFSDATYLITVQSKEAVWQFKVFKK
jgi:hypothetical protein